MTSDDAEVPQIRLQNLWWVATAALVLVAVVASGDYFLLDLLHVLAGLLWTGIDLFMGFVIGPIMRRLALPARREFIIRLMPRMIFIMPTLSIMTTTAGWFLAQRGGYLELPYPQFWWLEAALIVVTVLTVQGLGMLLPTNLLVYFEMLKPEPDMEKVGRWMRRYVRVVASQGLMQIAIIIVMARFVTGL